MGSKGCFLNALISTLKYQWFGLFLSGLKRPLGVIYLVYMAFQKFTKLSREIKLMPYFSLIYFLTTGYLFMKHFWSLCHVLHEFQRVRESFWSPTDLEPNCNIIYWLYDLECVLKPSGPQLPHLQNSASTTDFANPKRLTHGKCQDHMLVWSKQRLNFNFLSWVVFPLSSHGHLVSSLPLFYKLGNGFFPVKGLPSVTQLISDEGSVLNPGPRTSNPVLFPAMPQLLLNDYSQSWALVPPQSLGTPLRSHLMDTWRRNLLSLTFPTSLSFISL